jgi:phage-related minor tail protein
MIAGDPDTFAVTLTVGAWGRNIAIPGAVGYVVATAATVPAAPVGVIAAAGSYVTAKKFENDFWENINDEIKKFSHS